MAARVSASMAAHATAGQEFPAPAAAAATAAAAAKEPVSWPHTVRALPGRLSGLNFS